MLSMVLNAKRHMRAFAGYQIIRFVAMLAIVSLLVMLGSQASDLGYVFLGAELCVLFVLIYYINVRIFKISYVKGFLKYTKTHLWYGIRGMGGGMIIDLNSRVDVLMLGFLLTDVAVGIYSFAAMIAEGLAQFSFVLRRNIDPLMGRHIAKSKTGEIYHLIKKVRRIFVPLIFLLGFISVIAYCIVLTYGVEAGMLNRELEESVPVFIILMFGVCVNAYFRPFSGLFIVAGRPELDTLLLVVILGSNIILNAILIPIYGIIGAAVGD